MLQFLKSIKKRGLRKVNFADMEFQSNFAVAFEEITKQQGPFVYRLGRKIFILERGVRFSYGLLNLKIFYSNGKS